MDSGNSEPGLPNGTAKAAPFKRSIDVRVGEPNSDRRRDLGLGDPGVLPLKANDQVRIEAKLDRPGFLYVLWIDSEEKVSPVYPWAPGH